MYDVIVLTVPHCVSQDSSYRDYDVVAEKFAKILFDKFVTIQPKTYLIKSASNRKTLDDNRFQTNSLTIKNDSKLWNELRITLSKHRSDKIILFDIHSFPNNTSSFNGKSDIVILDNSPYQDIVNQLVDYFKNQTKHTIKIFNAYTGHNAIIDMFSLHPFYIPAILVEMNEKFLNDEEKLNAIADDFVNFINYYIKKN